MKDKDIDEDGQLCSDVHVKKKSLYTSKETYIYHKRPVYTSKETYIYHKRPVQKTCQRDRQERKEKRKEEKRRQKEKEKETKKRKKNKRNCIDVDGCVEVGVSKETYSNQKRQNNLLKEICQRDRQETKIETSPTMGSCVEVCMPKETCQKRHAKRDMPKETCQKRHAKHMLKDTSINQYRPMYMKGAV